MKRGKLDISWKLWSLIVGAFILLGFLGFSYAYESGSPSVMGHSADEIEGTLSGSLVLDCSDATGTYGNTGDQDCVNFGSEYVCMGVFSSGATSSYADQCTQAVSYAHVTRCCKLNSL